MLQFKGQGFTGPSIEGLDITWTYMPGKTTPMEQGDMPFTMLCLPIQLSFPDRPVNVGDLTKASDYNVLRNADDI